MSSCIDIRSDYKPCVSIQGKYPECVIISSTYPEKDECEETPYPEVSIEFVTEAPYCAGTTIELKYTGSFGAGFFVRTLNIGGSLTMVGATIYWTLPLVNELQFLLITTTDIVCNKWTSVNFPIYIEVCDKTTTPILSKPSGACPSSIVTVDIENYDATHTYSDPIVSGGSAVYADGVITWTLPATGIELELSITATEIDLFESELGSTTVSIPQLTVDLDTSAGAVSACVVNQKIYPIINYVEGLDYEITDIGSLNPVFTLTIEGSNLILTLVTPITNTFSQTLHLTDGCTTVAIPVVAYKYYYPYPRFEKTQLYFSKTQVSVDTVLITNYDPALTYYIVESSPIWDVTFDGNEITFTCQPYAVNSYVTVHIKGYDTNGCHTEYYNSWNGQLKLYWN